MLYFVAASESNQLLQCLYQHGVLVFDIIAGGQNIITGERAKILAHTMVGIEEALIDTCFYSISHNSLMTFEDFQLVYFEMFRTLQL